MKEMVQGREEGSWTMVFAFWKLWLYELQTSEVVDVQTKRTHPKQQMTLCP